MNGKVKAVAVAALIVAATGLTTQGIASAGSGTGGKPGKAKKKKKKPKPKKLYTFTVVTSQGLSGTITYHRQHPTVGARAVLASIPISVTCTSSAPLNGQMTTTTRTEQVAFGIAGNAADKANGASIVVEERSTVNPLDFSKRTLQVAFAPVPKKGKPPAWKTASGSLTYERSSGTLLTPSTAATNVCKTPTPVTFGP